MMIPSVIEKFGYAIAVLTLFLQTRMRASDLAFAGADALLGILFVAAFVKTRRASPDRTLSAGATTSVDRVPETRSV